MWFFRDLQKENKQAHKGQKQTVLSFDKNNSEEDYFYYSGSFNDGTITVAAVPQLREWFVGLFVSQNENNADVHAVQGAIPADDMNDEFIYYEPTFIPKGFVEESRIKDIAHLGIDYCFKNKIIFILKVH